MQIKISKQGVVTELDSNNLVSVEQTHDGIVFNFKNGTHLYNIDQYMPNHTKNIIKSSVDSFTGKSMLIDLGNYNNPVTLMS